jgi:putative ATPase
MGDLFTEIVLQPLARRMRPVTIAEYVGQEHLLAPGKPLYNAIKQGKLHSMILWGPPGVGKTALAELIANSSNARIERLSAVLAGVKDIRAVMDRAKSSNQATVLFVDEVHRFNKGQQDAFLPHIEQGTITFIGATTENPSFHLNNALLSRARVYVLKSLTEVNLLQLLDNAINDNEKGYGYSQIEFPLELRQKLAHYADGDARTCLNILEILFDFAETDDCEQIIISAELLDSVLTQSVRRFDKNGDQFYEQISALHKSIRGSDPDAALYWFSRMLDGGCDPHYIARRLLRVASEDIGNADPRALAITLDAWQSYERLGSPEGELALAQAVIFLACAAKSNASYVAFDRAMNDAKTQGQLDVPMHLRNAPTSLMQGLGYGKNYRYAHDEAGAFAKGEKYFPDAMQGRTYYEPQPRGLEIKIAEKLDKLRS